MDAARGQLPRLVNNAIRGDLTLITRFGKPAAYVVPADLIEALAGEPCPEQYDALGELRRAVGGVAGSAGRSTASPSALGTRTGASSRKPRGS